MPGKKKPPKSVTRKKTYNTIPTRFFERVIIENVKPQIDGGTFPITRVVGEPVEVRADIFADGHDKVYADLLFKSAHDSSWCHVPMIHLANDLWCGSFMIIDFCSYSYTVKAWVDHFATWQTDIQKKINAGQDVGVDIAVGIEHLEKVLKKVKKNEADFLTATIRKIKSEKERPKLIQVIADPELSSLMRVYKDDTNATIYAKELQVMTEPPKARFSTWYEMFPRSCSSQKAPHGTFKTCIKRLPYVASMGFDVLYLPPIHPIGKTKRKGKNNSIECSGADPGSPWAIGAKEGGHTKIHPQLGTLADFKALMKAAQQYDIDIALDIAFQCSPDHPYVKKHPEWFRKRPDGTMQYAENPPKKYEDIVPFDFESQQWQELWHELKDVFLFWINQGVRIFRVDNPHTKSFYFWDWAIAEIKKEYPDVIFLAEAFTRPKVMYRLAKGGFTQSYTYFTWRNTKYELTQYLTELTQSAVKDFFRPNFWANTPDILPEYLQYGGRPAFIVRYVLAATLSSNCGIYGPAYELCVDQAVPGREEYADSEKYEIKTWALNVEWSLSDMIGRINTIRKQNPALQQTNDIAFCDIDNEALIAYIKKTQDNSNVIITVVNLDPYHMQSGWLSLPIDALGIDPYQPFYVHDLISNDRYVWSGDKNFIILKPDVVPAHILCIHSRIKRENDFDYFM
jgi:starch synthase (maltosyl-transferring)